MKLTKFAGILLLLLTAGSGFMSAQSWDTSGNGLLSGSYYFRHIFYLVGSDTGGLSEATAVYGTINFSGSGTYSANITVFDSGNEAPETTAVTGGTYSIAASGYGFLSNPIVSGDFVYGLVNKAGIFIGSDTETADGYNDMFIAAPLSSPAPTAATFKGSYTIAGIDLSSGNPDTSINYTLQVSPDGVSNLGTGTLSYYVGQNGSKASGQSTASVKYVASNGAIVFTPTNSASAVITGQKFLYISPDGNFVFGGGSESWDMFVGVRTGSGAPAFSGLYYQAGLDQDTSTLLSEGYANLDTYYGSASVSSGNIIGTQRLLSPFNGTALDCTYSSGYTSTQLGTCATPNMNYVAGVGGEIIGSGIGPYLGINVAIPAPTFSGTGPYLNPTGIVNAASFAPFTAGISPGELITLYGTNLADSLLVAPSIPFPSTLNNVQVMINGVAAPIYYVSKTQVSVVVPFELNASVAQIQVITDGNPSNIVTQFTNETSAGVFSQTQNGLGYGAVEHANGSLVTPANPAQIGETVSVYVAGLGAVTPTVADGAAGVSSSTTNTIDADISGVTANITYAGLAPQYAGLYQMNLTIPTGLTNGDNYLDIGGPDSYTSEVLISIAGGTAAVSSANSPAVAHHARPNATKAVTPVRRRIPQ